MENQTPDKAALPGTSLAEQIARQLLEQGLIGNRDLAIFVQNLAEGRLREGDWRAVLSFPPTPEGQHK